MDAALYESLLTLIRSEGAGSEEDLDLAYRHFTPVTFQRGSQVLQPGSVCHHMYFVIRGYLRLYHWHDGEQVTTHINCPAGFMTSLESLQTGTPSIEGLEAVSDCILLQIGKTDLDHLVTTRPAWAAVWKYAFGQAVKYHEDRTRDLLTLSATDRYQKLLDKQPDLALWVPVQHLASYLGIKPESLSRIRRQVGRATHS